MLKDSKKILTKLGWNLKRDIVISMFSVISILWKHFLVVSKNEKDNVAF